MLQTQYANPSTELASQYIYLPETARITRVETLIPEHKLFTLVFEDPAVRDGFDYVPGQFLMLSIIGTGEAPISISSTPTRKGFVELCVRNVGRVTDALHRLPENTLVGMRGPYGNGFPIGQLKGHDLLMIVGGLGMAPLRSLLWYTLDSRREFGKIILAYGMRTPADMLFADEFKDILHRKDITCLLACEKTNGSEWPGRIGMVTDLFKEFDLDLDNTNAVVCGPPVMYRFVLKGLLAMNFSKDKIFMSLERKMKCGVGKCMHCQIGYKLTCMNGPIFTYWDAINLPEII